MLVNIVVKQACYVSEYNLYGYNIAVLTGFYSDSEYRSLRNPAGGLSTIFLFKIFSHICCYGDGGKVSHRCSTELTTGEVKDRSS